MRIDALAKPNQVAWLANQLAREHSDELAPLLELGADLRDASEGLTGDQLREFSRQQHMLVRALVEQAKRMVRADGRKVSEDTARRLQETLQAALADPEAAARLTEGRLIEGMQHVGFGPGLVATSSPRATQAGAAGTRARSRKHDNKAQEARDPLLERADRELQRATTLAEEAKEALEETRSELEQSETDVARFEDEVTRLRDDLESAEAEHTRALREHRRVKSAFDRADKAARDAVRRLQQADANHRRLAAK